MWLRILHCIAMCVCVCYHVCMCVCVCWYACMCVPEYRSQGGMQCFEGIIVDLSIPPYKVHFNFEQMFVKWLYTFETLFQNCPCRH